MTDKFTRYFHEHGAWSNDAFGTPAVRGSESPLRHLEREAREAYTETDRPKRLVEIVDCFALAVDAARREGMTSDDLLALAFAKLAVCKVRQWNIGAPDQPCEHVRVFSGAMVKP